MRALVISGRLIRFKSNTGINKERSLEVTEGEGKSGCLLFPRLLLFAFFAGPMIWVTGVETLLSPPFTQIVHVHDNRKREVIVWRWPVLTSATASADRC